MNPMESHASSSQGETHGFQPSQVHDRATSGRSSTERAQTEQQHDNPAFNATESQTAQQQGDVSTTSRTSARDISPPLDLSNIQATTFLLKHKGWGCDWGRIVWCQTTPPGMLDSAGMIRMILSLNPHWTDIKTQWCEPDKILLLTLHDHSMAENVARDISCMGSFTQSGQHFRCRAGAAMDLMKHHTRPGD
jgi:hypothetical protein